MGKQKDFTVENRTGYDLSNILLSHTGTMVQPKGWLVLKHDGVLANDEKTSVGHTEISEGIDDYWYLACNILIPTDKWKLPKKTDESKIVDGKLPVAVSNSKGWKQCNIQSEDAGARFILTLDHMDAWDDIKLADEIKPSESRSCTDWLEVVGHGGAGPTAALEYPLGTTGIAVLAVLTAGMAILAIGDYVLYLASEEPIALAAIAPK